VQLADHAIVKGLTGQWPALLGYNRVTPKANAEIVAGTYGKGRAVVFTPIAVNTGHRACWSTGMATIRSGSSLRTGLQRKEWLN
jgi:uncharacterized membrane protein